jgi:hypothetical protein
MAPGCRFLLVKIVTHGQLDDASGFPKRITVTDETKGR